MLKYFKNFAVRYNSYMTLKGRETARECLLQSSDRVLADAGFSRELLESGVDAWPWTVTTEDIALPSLNFEHIDSNKNIEELNAYSDKELNDLGISRGAISEAVIFGREGIERDVERKVA